MDEIKSDISKCFASLTLTVQSQSASFGMCPTQNCLNQLVLQNQNFNSHVSKVTLVIDRQVYELNLEAVIEAYQQQYCFWQQIQIISTDLQDIKEVSFLQSKLNIYLTMKTKKKRVIQLSFTVDINITSFSNVFINKYVYLFNQKNEVGFEVYFKFDLEKFDTVRQQIDALNYDRIDYRLTCQKPNSKNFLQSNSIIQTFDRFNESISKVKFSCTNMLGIQKQICLEMYESNMNEIYSTEVYNLDIMFYFKDKLIFLMKATQCQIRYTCWNHGVAVITKQSLNIQLTSNQYCDKYNDYYDYGNIETKLTLVKSSKSYTQYKNRIYNVNASNFSNFKYSCLQIDCSQIKLNASIMFQYYVDSFIEMYVLDKIINQTNYSKAQKAGITIGCILIMLVLVLVFYKIQNSIILINSIQIIKPQKKPTEQEILIKQLKLKIQQYK
ncbi:Conserved_hypothetical protein [Hexamita inflata]|uniref:Transmembrane protein n=1 Tax=Hexamita inflata TaxID=28002 RepID=A0AA86UBJ0_9EUKA|nr:Conserved hypothetical protein [Hexamita inflata]